jgi:hypothetical protein
VKVLTVSARRRKAIATKRFSLVLIIILLIAGLFSLFACSALEHNWRSIFNNNRQATNDPPVNSKLLTAYQLAEEVANAIRNAESIETAFNRIPAGQKQGLTLDQFQQYILLLRRGIPGSILSFSSLSTSEINDIRKKILERLPGETLAADSLGFWIHYQETGRVESKFAIFVQQEEGQAYLSADWIIRILNLSGFSTLYFDAINKNDIEALAALLQNNSGPQSVAMAKARRILEYYQQNISTNTNDFEITHVRIDSIGYEEYGITNLDLSKSSSRVMELRALPEGQFKINDAIPDILPAADIVINYAEQELLQFINTEAGQPPMVRSANLEKVIGLPLLHDDSNCLETSAGTSKIRLSYQQLELVIIGTCKKHQSWNGQIVSMKWLNPVCSLASGLKPGLSLQAVLERYPFADENGYELTGYFPAGKVRVKINIQNGKVGSLELSWLAENQN